jgi:hypothetical protein
MRRSIITKLVILCACGVFLGIGSGIDRRDIGHRPLLSTRAPTLASRLLIASNSEMADSSPPSLRDSPATARARLRPDSLKEPSVTDNDLARLSDEELMAMFVRLLESGAGGAEYPPLSQAP